MGVSKLERFKKVMIRILHPGMVTAILSAVLSTVALIYIFISEQQETIAAYTVYTFSVYSFAALAINVHRMAAKIKAFVHKNKFGNRYMTDIAYRAKVSLYTSLFLNLTYALFKMLAGIHYASFWFGADAIFYIILSIARFLLLRYVRKDAQGLSSEEQDTVAEFKKYRICGVLIFILNAAYIPVVYQIVNHGMGYSYPGFFIYVVATYTFYCMTISIINVIRYRKYNSPVLSAQKAISLAKALVAMFALQTAMFASFNEDMALERIMNLIFGSCVCLAIFCLAVFMVARANTRLKNKC